MAKRNLSKIYPKIDGGTGSKFGFDHISMKPTDTVPTASEGNFYYDDSENKLKLCTDGSTWTALGVANTATVGLDGAYDLNRTITVDGGAVTLAANGSIGLTVTEATNHNALYINNTAGTGNAIDIQNAGTGYDIQGSDDSWNITKAGVLTVTGVTGAGNLSVNDITATTSTVSITTDLTSTVAVALEVDTLTTGTALEIDGDAGAGMKLIDLQNASSSVLTIGGTGVSTWTGSAEGTSYITITAGDLTLTDGDFIITEGNVTITGDANADVVAITGATTGNNDVLYLSGTTSAGSGSILKIDQGAGARTGHAIDVNMGLTATGMSAIDVSCTGGTRTTPIIAIDSDGTASDFLYCVTSGVFTGNMINLVQDTAAGSGNFIFINNDSGTSMEAINIDDEVNIQDIVLINTAAATADNKALINLVATGTPAAAGSNMLRVDGSGMTATNVPTLVEIIGGGKTVQGLNIDADCTSVPVVLINGGGALTDNKAVLSVTSDGTLAAGGNALRVGLTGVPADSTACAVEIVAAQDCQALAIATSAATQSGVLITGSGATANNTAVFEVNWGASTPANAGSNLVRLDASGATNTAKPVIFEVYDDSVSTGAVFNTACTANDVVDIIVAGALADNYAGLNITSTGNLATGGNLARLIVGGTPHAASVALEINSGVGLGISVTSAALNNIVHIDGTGVTADDKAVLDVSSTGLIAAGASLVRISSTAAPAGATAYGMTINCNATNLEALWVEAGTVLIAETLTVTGGVQGKLGTSADLTATTPLGSEFDTAFGVANKTRGGFTGVVEDTDGKLYFVASDGTTWHFAAMTAAG